MNKAHFLSSTNDNIFLAKCQSPVDSLYLSRS